MARRAFQLRQYEVWNLPGRCDRCACWDHLAPTFVGHPALPGFSKREGFGCPITPLAEQGLAVDEDAESKVPGHAISAQRALRPFRRIDHSVPTSDGPTE